MSCCSSSALPVAAARSSIDEETFLASRPVGDGALQVDLSVPSIHCGRCIQAVESALSALPGVENARVNLSTRRVTVRWRGDEPPSLIATLKAAGYDAHLFDVEPEDDSAIPGELTRALAVAAFAAMNIMLLSASVWSGADPTTRDLFHWISALIALPTLAYSGRIFFRSAWSALRRGRTNMDVPISIGVLLAFALSLYETMHSGQHAYFDAAISLLFFLLIGRTLDHMMRERARSAVKGLAKLAPRGAYVQQDGENLYVPLRDIRAGMTILIAAGERVPVDARILDGRSDLDCSVVSGESTPQSAAPGLQVRAGMLNLTGPITVTATAAAHESLVAEMVRMMEAAEAGRSAYRRVADRAAALYAPVIHVTAAATFFGWMMASGDAHHALTIAIAVLIITCPCALGLAVPMVHVVAAGELFRQGVMIKDGGALERLADVDAVVFDKTGTLTLGEPRLVDDPSNDDNALAIAGALGSRSRHPYSMALAAAARTRGLLSRSLTKVSEHPGAGIEATIGASVYRLGRPEWAAPDEKGSADTQVVVACDGRAIARFCFEETLRPGARRAIEEFAAEGLQVEMLSGDRAASANRLAASLGLPVSAEISPGGKTARIAALVDQGKKPLMVGDGLNDAPALASAYASMAPASAADVGRNAADFVLLSKDLRAAPLAFRIARQAAKLVRQNFALAVIYNLFAVPLAIAGYVTPLIAALAMSLSSILVVANAMRLMVRRKKRRFSTKVGALPGVVERAA